LLDQCGRYTVDPAEAHLCCGSAGIADILQNEIASELGHAQGGAIEMPLRPT